MRYIVYRIIVCSRTKIRMISSLRNLSVRILDADRFTIVIFQILDIKSNYLPGIVQNVPTSLLSIGYSWYFWTTHGDMAIKGKYDGTRRIKLEWPIKHRPPAEAWMTQNKAIEDSFLDEEDITHHVGELYDEGRHQQTEWILNAREGSVYCWKEVKWERHEAKQRGRLRFENEGTTLGGPAGITH
jgi:hypothetical protein